MTLLDFARGPALQWAMIIFLVGVMWRLTGSLFYMVRDDLTSPRHSGRTMDGLKVIATRSLPAHTFEKRIRFQHYTGYAWHVGLFVTLLFFAPHIMFFESVLGVSWPSLPNSIILVSAAITLAILIALLIRRLSHPVMRAISNADDYISVLLVILPLLSGILAFAHMGLRYETMMALHILSVDALLIWFPFGKLIHSALILPSRFQAGATFGRRGVKA
jgi:nitrate reductase gamma subunit